jgi:TetR/AcrR family transcriptional regulator
VYYGVPAVKAQSNGTVAQGKAKQRIMESAVNLFAEKGYAETSVREIVASAGVTKPVLYYHFKNKEGLLRAILDWAASLQEDLISDVLNTPGTALQKLVRLGRIFYQGVMENPNLFRLIHNLIFGPPQGLPSWEIERFHRRLVDIIKGIYREGFEKGEVIRADPEDVAFLVLGIIDFCLHLNHVRPEFLDPDRSERLIRLAFEGIRINKGAP